MSTDRELLELAAKAAKIPIKWHRWPSTARETAYAPNGDVSKQHGSCYAPWNPLTNDGDALRLAIKLNITIQFPLGHKCKLMQETRCWNDYDDPAIEEHKDDPYAATRRAIVRAAAEIGRQMQEGGAA